MVTDSVNRRAQRPALTIVVRVDDGDWFFGSHLNNKLAHFELLFRSQTQRGRCVRAHGSVDVEPRIHDAHLDEIVDPLFGHKIVDVCLAHAGADADQQFVV